MTISYNDLANYGEDFFGPAVPYGSGILVTTNQNGDSCDQYHNLLSDPLFGMGYGNFRLDPTSPAIDAADPTLPLDPDGSPADMGAIYFNKGETAPATIILTPINPPVVIQPGGGSFSYDININIDPGSPVNMDIWIMMKQLPNGVWTGPYLNANRTLPGGANPTRLRTQTIPGNLESGFYLYEGRLGDYPNVIWHSSYIAFVKLSGSDSHWIGDFANTGEDFENDELIVTPEASFLISSISPNPFNPTTVLSFELRVASFVNLSVYDISGKKVAELVNGWREAGEQQVTFDGSELASRVYLCKFEAGDFTATSKIVLMK